MTDHASPPRHLDGSVAVVTGPYVSITFQHGSPHEEGVNGCRVEDLIDFVVEKLLDFQARALACEENESALYHLALAKDALLLRRKRRDQQGVLGSATPHVSA